MIPKKLKISSKILLHLLKFELTYNENSNNKMYIIGVTEYLWIN